MFKLTTTRRRLVAGTAALALVPAGVLALQPTTANGATTLSFQSKEGTFHFVDVAPKGQRPSPGDYFVFTSRLIQGGDRIGALHASCVVTRRTKNPDRTPLLCHGVYKFKGGTLVGETLTTFGEEVTRIAITGGTGKYLGASGVSIEDSSGSGPTQVTVELL